MVDVRGRFSAKRCPAPFGRKSLRLPVKVNAANTAAFEYPMLARLAQLAQHDAQLYQDARGARAHAFAGRVHANQVPVIIHPHVPQQKGNCGWPLHARLRVARHDHAGRGSGPNRPAGGFC